MPDESPRPERRVLLDEAMQRLNWIIEELQPSLRQVFVMRYVTQLPRQEIAEKLHISVGAVEQRLTRALTLPRAAHRTRHRLGRVGMRHRRSNMLSTRDPGPPDGMNPADYWAQLLFDGEEAVTDEQRAKFDAWLAESDANELDYRRAVAVQVMAPEAAPAGQVEHFSPRAENHSEQERIAGRRNIFKYAAAAAFVGLVGGGVYLERKNLFGETHSTRTGETRTAQFSDGSVAYLNTRTQVRWLGKGAERRVELVTGEALFDVVHDETHPFSVMLEGSEIRVLGTRCQRLSQGQRRCRRDRARRRRRSAGASLRAVVRARSGYAACVPTSRWNIATSGSSTSRIAPTHNWR